MSAALTADRVEWHLWNWQNWMTHCTMPGQYPKRASGGIRGYSNFDVETEYEEGDRVAAAAVQGILDGMVPAQRLAVYVRHGITRQVFYLRVTIDEAYAAACLVLAAQLAHRGMC